MLVAVFAMKTTSTEDLRLETRIMMSGVGSKTLIWHFNLVEWISRGSSLSTMNSKKEQLLIMSDKRYFTVYFTGLNEEKNLQRGKIHMFVEDGGYVNEAFVHEAIIHDLGLSDPYISGITELNESDWYDYLAGKESGIDDNNISHSEFL